MIYLFEYSQVLTVKPTMICKSLRRPQKIYGHVHVAKTAGTTLNGKLASNFERVCGHKGYSYDAYQVNKRQNASSYNGTTVTDGFWKLNPGYTRGRVHPTMMSEIGYEDCDYISHETSWTFWPTMFQKWPFPIELHVPCREPLSHLMSMCNFKQVAFNCSGDIDKEIEKCLVEMDRFSTKLTNGFHNIDVKCFAAESIEKYIDYMSTILQPRKIRSEYVFVHTNQPRNRRDECIWKDDKIMEATKSYLLNIDYYKFCHACMTSESDLLFRVGPVRTS